MFKVTKPETLERLAAQRAAQVIERRNSTLARIEEGIVEFGPDSVRGQMYAEIRAELLAEWNA